MRAFLGIGLDAHSRSLVRQWREQQVAGLRWVIDTNLHMTVVFLGPLADGQLALLDDAVRPIVAGQAPIDVQWCSVGWFPSVAHPRVLAWLPAPCDVLVHWQRQLVTVLQAAGLMPDARPYRPHISLARVADSQGVLLQATGMSHAMRMDRLSLFRSDSTPDGVHYTALKHWPLGVCR